MSIKKGFETVVKEVTPLLTDRAELSSSNQSLDSNTAEQDELYSAQEGEDDNGDSYISMTESGLLTHKKQNLAKIIIVAMVYFTSFALAFSPQLILLISKICRDKYPYSGPENNYVSKGNVGFFIAQNCDSKKAQELNSKITSIIMFLQAFFCILVSGKVGEFSDVHGRKTALATCLSFTFVSAVSVTFLLTDYVPFNMYVYLAAILIQALTGGMKSILFIMRSYVIDLVEPSERVSSLSIMTGTLFFGTAVGPLLSTFLNKASGGDDFVSMYVHCGGIALSVLCIIFFVPETHFTRHSKRQQESAQQPKQQPNGSSGTVVDLFKSLKLFWIPKTPQNPHPWGKRIKVFILVFIDILNNSAIVTVVQVAVLYSTLVFKWGSTQVGYLLSVVGFFKAFNSFVLIPAFMNYLRKKRYISNSDEDKGTLSSADIYIMRSAMGILLVETFLIITATRPRAIYLATIVGSFATINISTIQSCIVKLCSENVMHQDGRSDTKIGELFGALSLLENIAMMCISSSVMMVFSKTADTKPKTCFFVLFAMIAVAASFTWLLKSEPKLALADDNESLVDGDDDHDV